MNFAPSCSGIKYRTAPVTTLKEEIVVRFFGESENEHSPHAAGRVFKIYLGDKYDRDAIA
jgi:hypothetical protein